MLYLTFIFIISGLLLIVVGIIPPKKRIRLWKRLPTEPGQIRRNRLGSYFSPLLSFSQVVMEKLKLEESLRKTITSAHIMLIPSEFFSIKITSMLLLCLFAIFAMGASQQPALIVVFTAIGYIIPDLWLRKKISVRKADIARLLPETVDLLSLCIEAGLDFTTAVKWIIEKTRSNPMVEELSFVLEEIKWGKPRTQALRDMAKRLNIAEVSSFVQTLVQAERMGTPVAEAFTILSEDTRMRRFHRGERYALQAPIKILIPLIFCILPVIGIVIGGPIFLQFMQGGLLQGIGK